MRSLSTVVFCLLAACVYCTAAFGQVVVVNSGEVVPFGKAGTSVNVAPSASGGVVNVPTPAASTRATVTTAAWYGQSVPGGGTLHLVAPGDPATVNDAGRIAFYARVDNATRNQGIFVSDGANLKVIAMGDGGGGGSGTPGTGLGDPTPIGGTFSGFFGGASFTPFINNGGDVLFMADVDGGNASRALFLYRAATNDIVKVAAVGDAYPGGGQFGAISSGTMNDHGEVVFLGWKTGSTLSNAYHWKAGILTKVAAVGDPVPGGGTFTYIGTEYLTFVDTTKIPTGPMPSINELSQIAFRGYVAGGASNAGIFVSTGGVHAWYIKNGQATPAGGIYTSFQAAHLNNQGQIAFFADFSAGGATAGWFVGSPGSWRKVISFQDNYGGGNCNGLAYSRNPQMPLDDFGNCVVWTRIKMPGGAELDHLLFSAADGTLQTLGRQGDATPLGGTYGSMQAFVSLSLNGLGTLGAYAPGSGVPNAYFLSQAALPLVTDTHVISAAAGGVASFSLDAGAANANRDYFMLGSVSGIAPGLPLPGGMVTLPLNWDFVTEIIIGMANSAVLPNFHSVLDGAGKSTSQLNTMGAMPPSAVGAKLYFAYLLYYPVIFYPYDFVSNAVVITIEP